jgi:hypothetical protein
MLAILLIFGRVLSAMKSRLTALVVIALRMGGHLNNRGGSPEPGLAKRKLSQMDGSACKLEN